MSKRKELFVLVVAEDRVIAATLATVLQAGGYMVATTASGATAARIAGRMVVDALVIDLPAANPASLNFAAGLQRRYPSCHITLVCSPSQRDQAAMLMEEAAVDCDFILRPISRTELLAQLAAAPGVWSKPELSKNHLQVA
ncbi:MAG TPA: response regulator [Terriglobales bacterium]|nr:response regulator [Terriglobales bacterium]